MRTPASIFGHPIHVMVVTVPIGLWIFSFTCDLIFVTGNNPDLWYTVAYVTMAGGLVGAVLAAIFGLVDLKSLPHGSTRNLALIHMGINVVIVSLYGVNLWLRTGALDSMFIPLGLSLAAIVLLAVSGWLGGELVHVRMVGVDPDEAARRRAPGSQATAGARAGPDARSHP